MPTVPLPRGDERDMPPAGTAQQLVDRVGETAGNRSGGSRARSCARTRPGQQSQAQVGAPHLVVGGEVGHRPAVPDLPLLEHVGAIGHQLGEVHVLLGE